MHVEGPLGSQLKDVGAQDFPVAGHHQNIRLQGAQLLFDIRVAIGPHRLRLENRTARFLRHRNQWGTHEWSAPGRAGGPGALPGPGPRAARNLSRASRTGTAKGGEPKNMVLTLPLGSLSRLQVGLDGALEGVVLLQTNDLALHFAVFDDDQGSEWP